MRRAAFFGLAIAGAVACGGYGYETRTTTITGAPMITSGPQAGEAELPRTLRTTSQRVALAACTRENRCGHGEVSACMAPTLKRATEELRRWNCDPASIRARLEECLAGLDETSCDVNLTTDRRPICAANVACGDVPGGLVPMGRELAKIWR